MERAKEPFRPRRVVTREGVRRRLALAGVISFVALASLLAYAKATGARRGAYELAEDCPRGALVYAQASDLPALLRLWDGSGLKERYLASTNFRQFESGHVSLKLLERGRELGDAIGFTPDARALVEATEKSAAVAVYDIGRMEVVFVAPAGAEKALASRFFRGADRFEKTELPDGTVYYSRDVEADRGRQKQQVLFAFARGRFVLATGERLMLRTLANINGRSRADRLSDDPSFRKLSAGVVPHLAAVWVDQARLNGDYYFKHYWAMGHASELKGIRAGLFDFESREGAWLEHREYLLEGRQRATSALSAQDVRELAGSIPADAAYARVRVLGENAVDAPSLIRDAILDRADEDKGGGSGRGERLHEEFDPLSEGGEDGSWSDEYSYLGTDYDERIDDPSDAEEVEVAGRRGDSDEKELNSLAHALGQARPGKGAVAESPLAHDGPLFVEFRRLLILRLDNPGGLDRRALEDALASLVAGRLTVAGTGAALRWADGGEGARRRRELELPALGWRLCYALKGPDLFVSNDADFIDAALAGGAGKQGPRADARFATDDLTVIRLDRRSEAFDRVFDKLDAGRVGDYRAGRGGDATQSQHPASEEFFSGNVASLLDVASSVSRVEIRRRSMPGRLREEVELSLSGDAPDEAGR
jgi:hypothetical protein